MTFSVPELAGRAASGLPDYAVVAYALLAILLIERELLVAYGANTPKEWFRALAMAWMPLLLAFTLFAGAFVASYLFL